MIFADVYIIGFGPGGITRDVRVVIRSDADGIGHAELRDRHGVPFSPPGNLVLNCALNASFEVRNIPMGQFPVFVWADECANGNPTGKVIPIGPFLPTGSIDDGSEPALPTMCPPPTLGAPPSMQCVAARNEASRIRNELTAICTRLRRLRNERDGLIGLSVALYISAAIFTAAAIYTLASAAVLAGTFWGAIVAAALPIVAGILFAMAAAALAGAIAATAAAVIKQAEISAAEREYNRVSEQFRDAAMEVRNRCCPGDFFELEVTLPNCP